MVVEESSSSSSWSREQEKAFENALATLPEDYVKLHYEILVDDISSIELGRVPLPSYASSSEGADHANEGSSGKKGGHSHGDSGHGGKGSRSDQERRKGIAWTEDEHRLFLLGLDKYGKGIGGAFHETSQEAIKHPRHNQCEQWRRIDCSGTYHRSNKWSNCELREKFEAILSATWRAPRSQCVRYNNRAAGGGPIVSAVGTPVTLPVPVAPNMAYGVRAPVGGAVVPGAPVNMNPMNYQMPPTSSHR
uniref:Myb-like domain-containing protein n=1 Tax=Ananas comosus var. bracteatus TaxID=296719 RepID=A0A6V7NRF9_ANACO|nr:unnamed protein product [Ananas comosus var. bracteatus]